MRPWVLLTEHDSSPLGFEFVCGGRFERESGLSGRLCVKSFGVTGYRNF
jgi:hypothetical protein